MAFIPWRTTLSFRKSYVDVLKLLKQPVRIELRAGGIYSGILTRVSLVELPPGESYSGIYSRTLSPDWAGEVRITGVFEASDHDLTPDIGALLPITRESCIIDPDEELGTSKTAAIQRAIDDWENAVEEKELLALVWKEESEYVAQLHAKIVEYKRILAFLQKQLPTLRLVS